MRTVATFQLRLVDATDDGADARDSIEIHEGVLYGIAAVLPDMPRQKSGYIIDVSSVAGSLRFRLAELALFRARLTAFTIAHPEDRPAI